MGGDSGMQNPKAAQTNNRILSTPPLLLQDPLRVRKGQCSTFTTFSGAIAIRTAEPWKTSRGEGQPSSQPDVPRRPSASTSVKEKQISDRDQYSNPDPLVHLIGETNEAQILVDGVECTALIDSGAQVSTVILSSAKHLGLPKEHINHILNIKATGGSSLFGICRAYPISTKC